MCVLQHPFIARCSTPNMMKLVDAYAALKAEADAVSVIALVVVVIAAALLLLLLLLFMSFVVSIICLLVCFLRPRWFSVQWFVFAFGALPKAG